MILEHLSKTKIASNQMEIATEILKIYNPRASEVLSAEWKNFLPGRYLILEGKKKSCNVIIRDREILSAISHLPKISSVKIFPSLNYNKLFHHCKTYYSQHFEKFRTKKNRKVTHGFRYQAVQPIESETIIRDILFHRSVKSNKFYKQKGARTNENNKNSANSRLNNLPVVISGNIIRTKHQ